MTVHLATLVEGRDNNFALLRFVAAVLVITFHSYALAGQIDGDPITRLMGTETSGSIGVRAFFVISGFLVTQSFLARDSVLKFLAARILRIYPALLVATVFSIAMAALSSPVPLAAFIRDPLTTTYLIGNGLAWHAEFDLPGAFLSNPFSGGVNGSLWTIPVEIRLYLVCAILGVAGVLRNRIWFGIMLVAMIAACTGSADWLPLELRSDMVRALALEFGVGALAYVWRDRIPMSLPVGLALLALYLWNPAGVSTSVFTIPIFVYIVLVLALCPPLRFSAFNRVGDYSYGLYLYAFPIQQTLMFRFPHLGGSELLIASLVPTLGLAVLSWHLLEKPALGLKARP
jgi:peptidoglycan/LPS O-acetylase OafA/YrhL